MFSGGEEGVLVLWQYKTDHQVFLPRLSTPINHLAISPDDSLTAVSQRENGRLCDKVGVCIHFWAAGFISDQIELNVIEYHLKSERFRGCST